MFRAGFLDAGVPEGQMSQAGCLRPDVRGANVKIDSILCCLQESSLTSRGQMQDTWAIAGHQEMQGVQGVQDNLIIAGHQGVQAITNSILNTETR